MVGSGAVMYGKARYCMVMYGYVGSGKVRKRSHNKIRSGPVR